MITTSLWTVSCCASGVVFPEEAGELALPELLEVIFAAEEPGVFVSLEEATSAVVWLGVTIFSKSSDSDEQPKIKHTTPTHPKNVVIFFMFANIVYIFALH